MKRDPNDPVYVDEVVRRWQRRRWKVQQREAALAALHQSMMASAVYRWLVRLLG